ncbi:MAG: hypothetical protein LBR15_07785 [Methanobrevibacter sp.]|jgi:hypothetical protein|nr:hypothetical protein [Candidatus Methanovirga australis]
MNAKVILSLVTLGILMISSLGNVSAGDVGLWMSAKNDMSNHESLNSYTFNCPYAIYFDDGTNYTRTLDGYPFGNRYYGPDQIAGQPSSTGIYYNYPYYISAKPVRIVFSIDVLRIDSYGLTGYYSRLLTATMSMPVAPNGWVNGINKNEGATGMYFTASDVYSGGAYMDWIRCYFAGKEVFNMPGGKFHWPQGWTVEYPNGQVW